MTLACVTSMVKADSEVVAANLTMAAFNVQVFGASKAQKTDVMNALKLIFRKFDMVLMQEIREASGDAVVQLLKEINFGLPAKDKYEVLLSDRFGSSSSKEQYGWFYRPSRLNPIYTYSWTSRTSFERAPQAVWWNALNSPSNLTFVTVGLHADPDEVVVELDELGKVYSEFSRPSWPGYSRQDAPAGIAPIADRTIIMGDLNADCSYLNQGEKACMRDPTCTSTEISLWNPSKLHWLLDDDVDTTTKSTHCAYDRIIVTDGILQVVNRCVLKQT